MYTAEISILNSVQYILFYSVQNALCISVRCSVFSQEWFLMTINSRTVGGGRDKRVFAQLVAQELLYCYYICMLTYIQQSDCNVQFVLYIALILFSVVCRAVYDE